MGWNSPSTTILNLFSFALQDQCCQYIKYMKETKEAEDPEICMPEALREGKDRMIFGNIEAIYEWHRE